MSRRKVKTRKRKAPVPYESDDHMALAELLDYAKILYFHPGNELIVKGLPEKQRWRILNKMAKMGVKPGIPDFLILTRPPLLPDARALFLELKRRKGGKISPAQREWHRSLAAEGFLVIVAKGFEDAIERLEKIGFRLKGKST